MQNACYFHGNHWEVSLSLVNHDSASWLTPGGAWSGTEVKSPVILSLYRAVCTYNDLRCYCAKSSQWLFRPRGLSSQASLRALGALSSNLGLGGPIIQPGPGGPYHPSAIAGPSYPSNNYTRYMTLQSNGWGDRARIFIQLVFSLKTSWIRWFLKTIIFTKR